jgi:hypothetical protein
MRSTPARTTEAAGGGTTLARPAGAYFSAPRFLSLITRVEMARAKEERR